MELLYFRLSSFLKKKWETCGEEYVLCYIMLHFCKMEILQWVSPMNELYSVCVMHSEAYMCMCSLLQDNLLLDMYIAPHVNALYTQIRNRALIQYFSPYLSADMRKMAAAFNTTVLALEDELMQLILDGQIQARIDSHNKVCSLLTFLSCQVLCCFVH